MVYVYLGELKTSEKIHPAVVFFHGGGWKGGNPLQFIDYAEAAAKKEIVSILVEYRLENKHGATPFMSLEDAKSAMRFVRKQANDYHIDPNKIGAAGGSAGGHLAAACAVVEGFNAPEDDLSVSPRPDVLLLFNPVIDNGPNGYGYERVGEQYSVFSPIHNVKKNFPPTLFLTGSKDHLLPVSTVVSFGEKVDSVGGRCTIILYPGAEHGFYNLNKSVYYFKNTLGQFVQFLSEIGYVK